MWKQICRWCMPRGGWLLATLAFVVGAGVAAPLVAEAASVTVWNLGTQVTNLRIGPSDEVWTMAGDKPRMLEPASHTVTTYSHPLAGTGVLAVDGDGMVWSPDSFSPPATYVISRLDPTTLEVTSWPVDTGAVAKTIAVDAAGHVWFATGTTVLWRLAPASGTVTAWLLPVTGVSLGGGQPFDPSGRVWMCYSGGVAVLDPTTSYLTYWAEPSGDWLHPFPDTDGNAWFPVSYSGIDSIARLDTATNEVTEWPCWAGCDTLTTAVLVDSLGKVWFSADSPYHIGRLDPEVSPPSFTEWPLDDPGKPRWPQFDSDGNVWVYSARYNTRVARLAP